ncbi:hypothetical protein [Novosphingobium sp. PhB55]|uniref:hypothetical protein n=1 Tax=Novosphingobium sp. PhB55 TaxID=2485106 RepID=UPI00106685D4|nr:hypothetical protein [Novosphingobium sp. PhB55]
MTPEEIFRKIIAIRAVGKSLPLLVCIDHDWESDGAAIRRKAIYEWCTATCEGDWRRGVSSRATGTLSLEFAEEGDAVYAAIMWRGRG